MQVDDLVLIKRVAWKGRHKIQNKWEPDEYVVVSQPNKNVPVYRVKPIGEGKERVLHKNLLLPLGIKFVPEIESDSDSDHEEEPELEICQVERQISEGKPQATSVENMTPLADLEHGQGIVDPKLDSIVTPVDHVEPVEQGSMAPPVVISTDNLIDSQMSLDPKLLVSIDETVGSIPTQLTNLPSENSDDSLILPSTKENSDSLMKTEEFLDFVDDLSQKSSSVIEEEKTCHTDIAPSIQVDETSHSLAQESKPETFPSSNESELIEAQDISNIEVPKENGSVDSTDISITESQFSSTMPYCEESLVAKIDPMGTNQFLSAQPCHKEDTTSAHESVNLTMERGIPLVTLKLVLLMHLTARFLQMTSMPSLILFLILRLMNLIWIMIKCSPLRNLLLMKYLLNLVNLVNLLNHLLK